MSPAILLARFAVLIGFMALWEIAARLGWINSLTFGSPSGILVALGEYFGSERMLGSFGDSLLAVALSFVIGAGAGIAAGLALGMSPRGDAVFGPFFAPLNSIPRIALAPLFITWFGLTLSAKVALGVSVVFFLVLENARSAIKGVPADILTMGRVIGLSRAEQVRRVVFPSAVPSIFATLRLAWVYSLLGVTASEMVAAASGVGQDIVFYSSSLKIDTVFAILLLLMVLSLIVNALFEIVERRLLRWQQT